jgi:hypothetical protein
VTGPLPNVGGAPGVDGGVTVAWPELDGADAVQAAALASIPSGAVRRNCRRVFMMREVDISRDR